MVSEHGKIIQTNRWFLGFILTHLAIWTLAPSLLRFNLPLDAMEGATWGQVIDWGYDKNPFMTAWLTHMAISIVGYKSWALYFLSQLSIVICFIAIWIIAKHMLKPIHALIAVLLLESMQYYNLHAIDFSDNTLEVGIWSLIILFFYKATSSQRWQNWICVGIFAGLGLMTKYYTAMLLIAMFAFLIFNNKARISFKNPFLYSALIICLIIITPHILWLSSHDFMTVSYTLDRSLLKNPTWFKHLFFPIQFATQELEALIPPCLLLFILTWRKNTEPVHVTVNAFDKQFLLFIGLIPFLLTLVLSAVIGLKLRAGWGQPLLSLWGILFILYLQPDVTLESFYRFIASLLFLLCLGLSIYCSNILKPLKPNSANFPGKIIAAELTKRWHEQFKKPLAYVGGERWIAGNMAFYSNQHPTAFIDWNPKLNPGITEDSLRHEGAVFVWDLSKLNRRSTASPEEIKTRFPTLTTPMKLQFAWRHNDKLAPAEVLVAFLPPAQ